MIREGREEKSSIKDYFKGGFCYAEAFFLHEYIMGHAITVNAMAWKIAIIFHGFMAYCNCPPVKIYGIDNTNMRPFCVHYN